MNAGKPTVDRDSARSVLASGVPICENGTTTERAPDRVLGGPQSRALADWIGVDL